MGSEHGHRYEKNAVDHDGNPKVRDMGTQPPRTTDADGLDSIFAGGRDPSHEQLMAYAAFAAVSGNKLVDMGGTAFLTDADAQAYLAYRKRAA